MLFVLHQVKVIEQFQHSQIIELLVLILQHHEKISILHQYDHLFQKTLALIIILILELLYVLVIENSCKTGLDEHAMIGKIQHDMDSFSLIY
jgi:hypothetical protein